MYFTYTEYKKLIENLNLHGYNIASYYNWDKYDKSVILRHDIDYCIDKAVAMAKLEYEIGISSTYFVLITSDFYNVFSKENLAKLKSIIALGHEIGLHFDETCYDDLSDISGLILDEKSILEHAIGHEVRVVSMHRPSKDILEKHIEVKGMINSYSNLFFEEFKYLSDSRRRWREPVNDIIASEEYKRLHILTHAFWYNEVEETLHDSVVRFIEKANDDRRYFVSQNITDLQSILDNKG